MLRYESREVGHFGRAVRNTLDCRIDVGLCLLFFPGPTALLKRSKTLFCVCNVCLFKALCLFVWPNFPDPTFIPCPTSIPEARVAITDV